MKLLTKFVFGAILILVQAKHVLLFVDYNPDTAKILKCYDITCPSGTTACSSDKKLSDNLETVITTYKCENERGEVLYSQTEHSENPHPGVKIQSFSLSGVYHTTSNNFSNNEGVETYGLSRTSTKIN